jgi:hypothetical protein
MANWKDAIKHLGGSEKKERELIEKMAQEVRQVVESLKDEKNEGHRRRAQHAKMLAGIKNAEFRVSSGIPGDLRVGFLKPGMVYPAIVRFSNAIGFTQDDSEPDLRGVAIKITPPEGEEHDFLMTNAEEHHAENAFEAMSTSVAFSTEGSLRQLIDTSNETIKTIDGFVELAKRVDPFDAVHILLKLRGQMKIPVESLATETYWSRAPLRIGEEVVVKYLLNPVVRKTMPEKSKDDLSKDLKDRLEQGEVSFKFQVQRYVNEDDTPLEDARERWKSPHETIAELVIPQHAELAIPQQTSADDMEFFESLEFNPWHINTGDFEPVGSMNRARRVVYPSGVAARKQSSA